MTKKVCGNYGCLESVKKSCDVLSVKRLDDGIKEFFCDNCGQLSQKGFSVEIK